MRFLLRENVKPSENFQTKMVEFHAQRVTKAFGGPVLTLNHGGACIVRVQ
jgi:hypothetical protein